MNIDRPKLQSILDKLKPSISAKDEANGMNYFLFSGTDITTYNDKISIQHPFKTNFQFFVTATDFYKLISKLTVKEIILEEKADKLHVKSKTVNASLPTITDDEVSTRISAVSNSIKKAKFKALPENFISSITLCSYFASTIESDQSLTCVYVDGSDCTASDNYRIAHATLDGPVDTMFIRATEIKALSDMDPTEYCVSKSWIHFRNADKCVFSIRAVKGNFPDFLAFFDFEGKELTLPDNIIEGMDITSIFADDSDPVVNVTISKGFVIISVTSDAGNVKYRSKIDYTGEEITFAINPEFLKKMMAHSSMITISDAKARLETDDKQFSLVTALYGE